ncbi:MAG: hypothetical protein K0U37_03530 [Gammaproteobacteria bacterium]|nr:hypothetical protein [Gammaproteobacteria bacterium]
MSLEIFFRHVIKRVETGTYPEEAFFNWLLSDDKGVPFAHALLKEVSTDLIKWMLSFVVTLPEPKIYCFLMSRDLEGNTIGHVVLSQSFSIQHDLVRTGLLDVFLNCIRELSSSCRPEFLRVRNNSNQLLDDVVKEMRVDAVRFAYFNCLQDSRPKLSIQSSQTSAFSSFGAFSRLSSAVANDVTLRIPVDGSCTDNRPPEMPRGKVKSNNFFKEADEEVAQVPGPPSSLKKPSPHRKKLVPVTLPAIDREAERTNSSAIFK